MNKVWIVAGIVLCFALLLGAWVFLGDFSNFAKRLGSEGKDIALGDQNSIIGTWILEESSETITFLSNGGYSSTIEYYGAGTYAFKGEVLELTVQVGGSNGDSAYAEGKITFNYDFFDDNTLILTNVESGDSQVFAKQE